MPLDNSSAADRLPQPEAEPRGEGRKRGRGAQMDFDYLETYAGGDMQVVTEVLALFQGQAEGWLARLEAPGDGWRDLAHTIKGAARGIGATRLGDVADAAERADAARAPDLRAALTDVLADIEDYLARVGGG